MDELRPYEPEPEHRDDPAPSEEASDIAAPHEEGAPVDDGDAPAEADETPAREPELDDSPLDEPIDADELEVLGEIEPGTEAFVVEIPEHAGAAEFDERSEPVAAPQAVAGPVEQTADVPARPRTVERADLPRNLRLGLALCLIFGGLIAIGVHVLLAWTHHADRYGIDDVAGAWIAMSRYADEGLLYPPFYDEATGNYGGGRQMPVGVLVNAFAAQFTGEYLTSAKLVSAASALLLVYLMGLVMGRLRCSTVASLGAIGAALMTGPMLVATTSVRVDALPAALQLLAVMLFVDRKGRPVAVSRRLVFTAALACTAAIFCRLSALWAPVAIVVWLLARERRWLWTYLGYQVGMLLVVAAFFHLLSDGRFVDNVFALGGADNDGMALWLRVPLLLFMLLVDHAPATWVLLPLATFGLMLRAQRGDWHIVHIGLVASFVVLVVGLVTADARANDMLDVIVLGAICAADVWRIARKPGRRVMEPAQAAIAVMLLWSMAGGLVVHVRADILESLAIVVFDERPARYDRTPLAGFLATDMAVLSEDPSINVTLGQRPVVLDAGLLRQLSDQRLAVVEPLVERIGQRKFDAIVLIRDIDEQGWWYEHVHFGRPIRAAIEEHYRLVTERHGLYLYGPMRAD